MKSLLFGNVWRSPVLAEDKCQVMQEFVNIPAIPVSDYSHAANNQYNAIVQQYEVCSVEILHVIL